MAALVAVQVFLTAIRCPLPGIQLRISSKLVAVFSVPILTTIAALEMLNAGRLPCLHIGMLPADLPRVVVILLLFIRSHKMVIRSHKIVIRVHKMVIRAQKVKLALVVLAMLV